MVIYVYLWFFDNFMYSPHNQGFKVAQDIFPKNFDFRSFQIPNAIGMLNSIFSYARLLMNFSEKMGRRRHDKSTYVYEDENGNEVYVISEIPAADQLL